MPRTARPTADRRRFAIAAIVLSAICFVMLGLAATGLLRNARLDLTADGMYSLSGGTREVLATIDEPVTIRVYRSAGLGDLGPQLANHATRVQEMLDQYVELADGKLRIEHYDPQPFSTEEDLAVADGLRPLTIPNTERTVYFGLAGVNSTDDRDGIAFLSPDRAAFLEYDLTKLVHDLANPEKRVVAIYGDLPIGGSQENGFRPWSVLQTMQQFFAARTIQGAIDRIADDIQVLVLVQPETLPERTLYAIDQFVMRGGRVLLFADPLAESMAFTAQTETRGRSAVEAMEPLLAAWGVRIEPTMVVGDADAARRVQTSERGRPVVVHFLPWLQLGAANMSQDDAITGSLQRINMNSAGFISARDGATTAIEPLLVSSSNAQRLDRNALQETVNPVRLLAEFQSENRSFTLAARIAGPVRSAFPDGPPASVTDETVRQAHRDEAVEPLAMVLVADTDLLADSAWLQPGGPGGGVPMANNADFAINAMDTLTGTQALISLRGRGLTERPFEVLATMERRADETYRATEERLLSRIEEMQSQILETQQGAATAGIPFTAEQQERIETTRREMIALRQELRQVQFSLREDVESLSAWVKTLNIAGMPLLVALFALGLAVVRNRRAARRESELGGA